MHKSSAYAMSVSLSLFAAFVGIPTLAVAQHPQLPAANHASHPAGASQYEPYRFLIGSWKVTDAGGNAVGIARFRWGTGESYIWHSMALLADGGEQPHYEGLLLWNEAHHNLDMLLALDLQGGRVQERGDVSIASDGTVTREITAIGPRGEEHFRQTYQQIDAHSIRTSAMRKTKDGWEPTFPGGDRLTMTRMAEDAHASH